MRVVQELWISRRQSGGNLKRKSSYLARVGGVFGEDLSAPLGFGLISGAEDDDDDDAEPRSALLRTAGPHRRKASVSPLGHSHH